MSICKAPLAHTTTHNNNNYKACQLIVSQVPTTHEIQHTTSTVLHKDIFKTSEVHQYCLASETGCDASGILKWHRLLEVMS